MNRTYFKFLFVNLSRKKAIWILFCLFLLTISAFLIIIPVSGFVNPLQAWAQPTMVVCQTFVSIISSLFTAILAVNIFKDTNEDGSDLIIISKPVKKYQIIFSKILVFASYCMIANLASVLITIFTIFLPKTEYEYYWKLIFSLFIGNFTSFAVFGSIAILTSTKVSKIGIIIINLCMSLLFLIYQIIGLFVIPTPTKTMLENEVSTTSYTISNRNISTGEYTEDQIVNFNLTNQKEYDIKKDFSNYNGVKQFWTEVNNKTPTTILNATDLASQLSYTYLSAGLQDYSDRQAQRFFASSTRAYNYNLLSPASPEFYTGIDNQKTIPFIYEGYVSYYVTSTSKICLPKNYLYAGIPGGSFVALKGFSNTIPIATIKTKEFTSDLEIYLEPNLWTKYSKPFDIMIDHCFDSNLNIKGRQNYYDVSNLSPNEYYKSFAYNNENVAKMFEIIWACLTGHSNESKYFGTEIMKDGNIKYDQNYFDIKNTFDLNERLLQFKYYTFIKLQYIQNKLISSGYVWKNENSYEPMAQLLAVNNFNSSPVYSISNLSEATVDNWFLIYKNKNTDENKYIDIITPNTKTVSFQLLVDSWNIQEQLMEENGLDKSSQIWIDNAKNSALSKILQLGEISANFSAPNEKYLYVSLLNPERTADATGTMYINSYSWIPNYLSYLYPAGQNVQLFFYNATRKYNYWFFTILWLSISVIILSCGIIVYNKYDIK